MHGESGAAQAEAVEQADQGASSSSLFIIIIVYLLCLMFIIVDFLFSYLFYLS